MAIDLRPEEELALLHTLDRLPADAEPAFKEHLYTAVRKVLGATWLGRQRVYFLNRPWAYDATTGLWVRYTAGLTRFRARVAASPQRPFLNRRTNTLCLWGPPDFPETLYVVSADREDPTVMKHPRTEEAPVPVFDLETHDEV